MVKGAQDFILGHFQASLAELFLALISTQDVRVGVRTCERSCTKSTD